MNSEKSVMVFGGTGRVGSYAILFLARNTSVDKILFVCREPSTAYTIANNSIIAGAINGAYPKIEVVPLDLFNTSSVIKILKEKRPQIILNSAAMISLYPFFPRLKNKQRSLGYISGSAHFLPKDLGLLYPLMEAVRESGIYPKVVNVAAPDIAPAVLEKVGLSPTVGAGTIDLTVQGVRQSVALKLDISMSNVSVQMVAQHAIRRFPPNEVPHYLRIYVKGEDITADFPLNEIIMEAVDTSGVETSRTLNVTNAPITAASAVRNVLALFSDKKIMAHASGVDGIPGGFPVELSVLGAELSLPNGLTRDEVIKINTEGMKIEGVENIEEDGTVILTEHEKRWIREGLGLNWESIPLSRLGEMANELINAYQNL